MSTNNTSSKTPVSENSASSSVKGGPAAAHVPGASGGAAVMRADNRERTKKIVGTAALTAIVIVLQLLGSFIRFGPFSISLVLIPIIVGAAMYGIAVGGWLGFVFGAAVMISGDANLFFGISVVGTVITVLLKGTLAGLLSGLVYTALKNKGRYLAVIIAAIVCPVVNTGIFLIGCALFFMDTINTWAAGAGFDNVGAYLIIGMVGVNFLVELAVNVVLSPVVVRLIDFGRRR